MYPHEVINRASTIRVISFRIQETGTYNTQYARPYTTDMNRQSMQNIVDHTLQARARGQSVTPIMMADANNGKPIVEPVTRPEGTIEIPNGWTERRFRFMLVIESKFHVGGTNRLYYTGYSTHADMSYAGSIDPNMQFFINSVVRTRIMEMMTPQGSAISENLMSGRHLISNNNWEGCLNPHQTFLMRPEDVFNQMQTSHLGGNDVIIDTRNQAQRNATTSNLGNGLAHNYSSTIINSYLKAGDARPSYDTDGSEIFNDARRLSTNQDDNPLTMAIAQLRQYGLVTNTFTLNELTQIDINTPNVTEYFPLTQGDMGIIHAAGQTADWMSEDGITMAAVKIGQAIPALMSSVMLQKADIISTNSSIGGQPETKVVGVGINASNIPMRCQMLGTRFETELIRDISFNNCIPYYIEVKADVFGETRIRVSLNGGAIYDYAVPSFCDNLLTPIVTTDAMNSSRMGSDFSALLSDIGDNSININQPSIDSNFV